MDIPVLCYLIIAVADAAPLKPRVFIAWIDVDLWVYTYCKKNVVIR